MDRGFGSFRGSNYSGINRQSERYDDFYSDARRGGQGRISNNRNRNSAGEWGGGNSRDRGFFNQGYGGRDREGSNVGGQVLAAMQHQQNLLRAFMSQSHGGILPQPGGGSSFGQGRNYGNRGFGNNRAGDKRKQDMRPSGFQNRNKKTKLPPKKRAPLNSGSKSKSPATEKKTISSPTKDEEVVIPDEEVEIPDSLMDSVEKLRQRSDIQRNVADEDVQKLLVFCYSGKGYQCLTCGLLLTKEQSFLNHLESKGHVMNVIDARTAKKYQEIRDILDIDLSPDDWYEKNEKARAIILKQAKMVMKTELDIKRREIENYNKNPANFFTVSKETMKAAVKNETTVVIKSIVETTMEVKEFASDRHFGCEFIKAVSSFHCRLCNLHINCETGVIPHIESRLHKSNYQSHLRKTPDYEAVQNKQNKELIEALGEQECKFVLLCESPNALSQTFLSSLESLLVRVPKLYKPDPAQDQTEKQQDEAGEEASKQQEVQNEENETVNENNTDDHIADETEESHEYDQSDVVVKEEGDDIADENDTETNEESVAEEEAQPSNEVSKPEQVKVAPTPKKSILKKSSTPTRNRGGSSRRGRGKSTPSPRTRVKKSEVTEIEEDDTNDGSCMDAFHVVDEVAED